MCLGFLVLLHHEAGGMELQTKGFKVLGRGRNLAGFAWFQEISCIDLMVRTPYACKAMGLLSIESGKREVFDIKQRRTAKFASENTHKKNCLGIPPASGSSRFILKAKRNRATNLLFIAFVTQETLFHADAISGRSPAKRVRRNRDASRLKLATVAAQSV
jgi:hypothetical protein